MRPVYLPKHTLHQIISNRILSEMRTYFLVQCEQEIPISCSQWAQKAWAKSCADMWGLVCQDTASLAQTSSCLWTPHSSCVARLCTSAWSQAASHTPDHWSFLSMTFLCAGAIWPSLTPMHQFHASSLGCQAGTARVPCLPSPNSRISMPSPAPSFAQRPPRYRAQC